MQPSRTAGAAPIEARPVAVEARSGGVHAVRFLAMGSPCEILVADTVADRARAIAQPGIDEAWRVERKFSRYRADSVVAAINGSGGRPVAVDAETRRLLDYAAHCHALSDGRFDITAGVLHRAWTFDGTEQRPDPQRIRALQARIGFGRLQLRPAGVSLPEGMEIDLGGLAKEYAVDRALEACASADTPVLVNFGGDLHANRPPPSQPWQVAIEDPGGGAAPAMVLELTRGALATSGDAHRYVLHEGVRYGHILDPGTGWPVVDAPRSVTVAAGSCVEAGTLSTIAMLQGAGAEAFLEGLDVRCWFIR